MGPKRTGHVVEPGLLTYATRLRDELQAERVLLFGSRARGQEQPDSDYDVIIVSPRFEGVERWQRADGLREIFYEVAGRAPIDLICLTPEEFESARQRITLIAAILPEAIDLLPPTDDGSPVRPERA